MAVSVEDGFVRVGGKSYAINKINSVEVRSRKVRGKGAAVFWTVMTVLVALIAIAAPPLILLALLLAFVSWRLFKRPDIFEHELFLMTSSSESSGIKTRDQEEIDALRSQIEGAMLREARGGGDR